MNSNHKMIILHYIPNIDRSSGGIGSYMQLLAKELGKIVELHVATHQSAHPLDLENCVVHPIAKWNHWWRMKKDWVQLLNELRPDVVHCNCCWEPGSPMAQRWAQERGFKVVLSPHGMLEPWILKRHHYTRKLPALWLYQRKAISQADCIHATAESEKEHLLQLGWNNKITVVPNGVDVEFISMKSSWKRTNNILFLSRVHPKKGLNFLIEAFAHLKGNYKCTIAGEGETSYINELKALAARLGVSDRVTFVGGIYGHKKWQLLQNADVFVLPTHSENFGIVIAEALASGTPVITTTGAPWHELHSFHCGWWTEIGMKPLLDALRSFANCTEDELKIMGLNGRKLIEQKYSTKAEAEAMVKLYQQFV